MTTAPLLAHRSPARLHLSESALGASPLAARAAAESLAAISVYPDPVRTELTAAIAAAEGVHEDQVAVANGSDELVLLSSFALGRTDRPGLTTAGTFPGYRVCLEAVGRGCTQIPLLGTGTDVAAFAEALPDAGVAYLCNPHNPTGGVLTGAQLDLLVARSGESGVPLVVDEAYREFADPGTPSLATRLTGDAPVLALRTFSKAYGLASLRIGYAIGATAQIAALRAVQGTMPFSANRAGQAAALAALADQDHLVRVREQNALTRDWFCAALSARGRDFLPSATNFVTVVVPDSADAERRLAEEHAILTRDAGRFGLPGHLRVSLGAREDLDRLLDALDLIAPVTSSTPVTSSKDRS